MLDVESGVDISLGDRCSKAAFSWAQKTFSNRDHQLGMPDCNLEGSYASVLDFSSLRIAMSSDGIGTKIEVAERMEIYDTLGFDLVAMIVDDLICNGIEPTNLSNILDVDFLDQEIVDSLMKGLHDAANIASIAVTGGEIAELGPRITGYGKRMHFNWCATGIGVLRDEKFFLDGSKIKPGDKIVALQSLGLRSNGFSMARKIMEKAFGDFWHLETYAERSSWGDVLLTPSQIYSPLVTKLQSLGFLHGVVHVTGGGIEGNLVRVLKKNRLGAKLDNLFDPEPFVHMLQKLGNLCERLAYQLWNMGNGMFLLVDDKNVEKTLGLSTQLGYMAKIVGSVQDSHEIVLHSRGICPEVLVYKS